MTSPPRPRPSLGDTVYTALRAALLDRTFDPGEPLTEHDLCRRFRVSRTSVREAMRALESRGLIGIRPGEGAFVREVSVEGVKRVAETLKYAIGQAYAAEILSQWEGFGRFCRDVLRVEPVTLLAAYGLGRDDPAADVLAVYLDAKADEARAAHWADVWKQNWDRRFAKP